jgi:hypothetical protein
LSSISVAQPHPRTLEESFLVGLFGLEDDLYPLQGHYQKVDFINVGHHANAELHVPLLRITPASRIRLAVLQRPVPDSHALP